MVKCIDEYHHIGGGMLQCDHEDGGGATRHYQAGDYCQFCGTRLDIWLINLPTVKQWDRVLSVEIQHFRSLDISLYPSW